jgi:hypothetical protein
MFFCGTFADDYPPLEHNHFIADFHALPAESDLASKQQLKAES